MEKYVFILSKTYGCYKMKKLLPKRFHNVDLKSDNEYKKWKEQIKIPISENDEKELKEYLKKTEYVFKTTIWTSNGNGTGYYGLYLKKEVDRHRTTSSTGKKVEKRSKNGNLLLGTWETIAKAAEAEKICAAKMSRCIKDGRLFNDDYYYCAADK